MSVEGGAIQLIQNWIVNRLSQKQDFLGNLPACPYALESLLNNQLRIADCSVDTIFQEVSSCLAEFDNMPFKMHVLVCSDWKELELSKVVHFVKTQRDIFYKKDLWLLYDHPDSSEIVQGYNFNQGQVMVFMVQKLSDLVLSAKNLMSKNYYKNWPQEYFEEVVLLRESYYQRYLSEQRRDEARW
jgi:ABC-type cobalamin transport system ATPase subunit